MLKINLKFQKENKSFNIDFISGRMIRRTLEIVKKLNLNDLSPEELDEMVDYVVQLFGNKFSRDEFYDGIEANKMMGTIQSCITTVMGGVADVTSNGDEKNE